jgi:hypothetical protein
MPAGVLVIPAVSTGTEIDPTMFHPFITLTESELRASPEMTFVSAPRNFAQ